MHNRGYAPTNIHPLSCKQPHNGAFNGQCAVLRRPHWGYVAPHGFTCTPIVTKSWPNKCTKIPWGRDIYPIVFFLPTHRGIKTAKSSPLGPHRGANLGKLQLANRPPSLVWESKENKKGNGTMV